MKRVWLRFLDFFFPRFCKEVWPYAPDFDTAVPCRKCGFIYLAELNKKVKKEEFYGKYANTPMSKRFELLSNDYSSSLLGMTLHDVYEEVKKIDDKLRSDVIRREKLLIEVEKFLAPTEPNNK